MTDTSNEKTTQGEELAPGDVTDFIVVLMAHDKGRAQAEASQGLAECVDAALATGKKGGKVTVEVGVEPLESGAVKLEVTVKSAPKKEPAGSIWFTDGEGHLSRDNANMYYGSK
ncbi:hypothetical protein AB0K45_09680 [Micrococcus luteus]|uniref:hypothetical protein n=1 Tax=Micrococcus luteus TaxID=1270 RepID=UPI0034330F76